MSKPQYVLDTNVFINMQRHSPRDIPVFKQLWDKLESLIEDGVVVSSEEVFDELSRGDDTLIEWIKSRKSAFLPSDEQVQLKVREILKRFPDLLTGSKKANTSDPFVIALASILNCVLVSDETRAGKENPAKIPNVCDAFKVSVMKYVEFLRIT